MTDGRSHIKCDYCKVYNPYGNTTCECCGAPLDYEDNAPFLNWGITNNTCAMPLQLTQADLARERYLS